MNLPTQPAAPTPAWLSSKLAFSIGNLTLLDVQFKLGKSKVPGADSRDRRRRRHQPHSALTAERPTLKPDQGIADNRPNRPIPVTGPLVNAGETALSSDGQRPLRDSGSGNTAGVNFWDSLSPEQRRDFESVAIKRVFAAGARLMQEGEQADHVAVIRDGWTEIRTHENGRDRVLARRGPGQLIGERAALEISVRSATVVATGRVDALVMRTEDFAAFVSAHQGVLRLVENQIFTRMREGSAGCEHDQSRAGCDPERTAPPGSSHRARAENPHLNALSGENCTVIRTDVVAFAGTERNDSDRAIIRAATLTMTRSALGAAWDLCHWEDRGDGLLLIVPPGIPTAQAMQSLLTALPRELAKHNQMYRDPVQVQLRIAFDVGPVTQDTIGVSGRSIIVASRMLDAPEFKEAIARTGAVLGVIASPFVYEIALTQRGGGSLDPAGLRRDPGPG